MRQDQLVAGAGHRHVAQPSFLGQGAVRRGRLAPTQSGGQRQGVAAAVAREATGDQPGQVHDREFEALGLVHRQHRDRVRIRIEVGRRRVVTGFDQRLEVAGHEHRPVVGEQGRLGADDVEEPGDVAEPLLGRGGLGAGQPREHPAVAQEGVQHLARRAFVGHRRVAGQVRDEPTDRLPARRGDAQDARLPLELVERRPHRPMPAAGGVHDRRQVLAAQAVDLRRGERVQVDARFGVRDRAQERHEQAHLRSGVQPRRTGEPPRDAGHVQRSQDGVGVAVGADQDRVVARARTRSDAPGDVRRDPVGLLGTGRERLEPYRSRRSIAPLRLQPLARCRCAPRGGPGR